MSLRRIMRLWLLIGVPEPVVVRARRGSLPGYLDELGEMGWEPVGVVGDWSCHRLYFKHLVPGEAD